MEFVSREHFDTYLRGLKYLGQGSQGSSYLNTKNNTVYKVFNDYFDEEEAGYTEDFLLRFSDIKNSTFIWPNNVIKVAGTIVGYTMPYKRAKNLCNINPLLVNLDKLEEATIKAEKDVKTLTDNEVRLYDVRYNILYNNSKMYVIDTLEYGNRKVSYEENRMTIDDELMLFLVDNYFEEFVKNDKLLNAMYREFEVRGVDFLKVFRNKLSEYVGKDITKLDEVKHLVRKNNSHIYQRGFDIEGI